MTINHHYVYVPENIDSDETPSSQDALISEKEAQRQALVKQAQQQGGLLIKA